jgi:hypothetical protein
VPLISNQEMLYIDINNFENTEKNKEYCHFDVNFQCFTGTCEHFNVYINTYDIKL